jgi:lipoate-protein ligase A
VANIREFAREPITVEELRERILEAIFGTRDRTRIPTLSLTEADWEAIQSLVERKYGAWAWNYGENPRSNVHHARRFPAGEIDARIDVQAGQIAALRLFGDFMGRRNVAELEARLRGVRFERPAIAAALAGVDVAAYFGDIGVDDVISTICG